MNTILENLIRENTLTNFLSDKSLNGLIGWICNLYGEICVTGVIAYNEQFSPNVKTFITYVGEMVNYQEYMNMLASTLAVGIFVFYLGLVLLKKIRLADIHETLPVLVGKLILVLIGISNSVIISNSLFDLMDSVYTSMQMYGFDTSLSFMKAMIKLVFPLSFVTLFTSNNVLICILCVIFGIIFTKEFLKLILKVIEQYIVACLLKYSFSLPLATCVTKNTSGIFKKYVQMYLSQILLLILNTIMVNMVIRMVNQAETMENIVGWMFMFAFIKVCQRIDKYLYTMGMSVAITGGSIIDQVGYTFKSMGKTVKVGNSFNNFGVVSGNMLGAVRLDNSYNERT